MKRKIIINSVTLTFVTILSIGCNQQQSTPEQQKLVSTSGATILNFVEQERGVKPYPTRLIVTEKYLRFDDGEGSADFVLLDRNKNVIYSVNSTEGTVMAVHKKEIDVQPPYELELTQEQIEMNQAPACSRVPI